MAGQLFVISAPSGAGKSTIIGALRTRMEGLGYSISHTSRRPRGAERDGVEYHFVDRETFRRMIDSGAFVEWAKVYQDYYGTSFSALEEQLGLRDVVLDVDVQGARNIRKRFETSILIYLLPPSLAALEERLRGRGTDSEDIITARMRKAEGEMRNCVGYDYIVINGDLIKAVGEVASIIVSGRCRKAHMLPAVKEILGPQGGTISE